MYNALPFTYLLSAEWHTTYTKVLFEKSFASCSMFTNFRTVTGSLWISLLHQPFRFRVLKIQIKITTCSAFWHLHLVQTGEKLHDEQFHCIGQCFVRCLWRSAPKKYFHIQFVQKRNSDGSQNAAIKNSKRQCNNQQGGSRNNSFVQKLNHFRTNFVP